MVKLIFFVRCKSWKNGGYENTHYFQTENEARSWAEAENVEILSIDHVSQKEFSEDFMGGCY